MKKLILSITAAVALTGASCVLGIAWGQATAPRAPVAAGPHKIGLIDMAHVFNEYSKFNTLREDLRAEIEGRETQLKGQVDKLKTLQAQLQAGTFAAGSPDAINIEKQMTQLSIQLEADRKEAQREFFRKESKIYQTVYQEVVDMVEKYAQYHKYTLIMRFNRENLSSDEPQQVMQALQKQVVFFNAGDDITEPVLAVLNKQYGGPAAPKTQIANPPKPGTRTN